MNALANEEVGKYLNEHFVSAYQKVGTFTVVNGQKQGGNVASYFCLSDGSVLHAIAGPVDAATFLREARWIVETRKLAITEGKGDYNRYKTLIRKAHVDRLQEQGENLGLQMLEPHKSGRQGRNIIATPQTQQGKIHLVLANNPLVKIDQVYEYVFEKILGEKISTLPVVQK